MAQATDVVIPKASQFTFEAIRIANIRIMQLCCKRNAGELYLCNFQYETKNDILHPVLWRASGGILFYPDQTSSWLWRGNITCAELCKAIFFHKPGRQAGDRERCKRQSVCGGILFHHLQRDLPENE